MCENNEKEKLGPINPLEEKWNFGPIYLGNGWSTFIHVAFPPWQEKIV